MCITFSVVCAHGDSNSNRWNRNPIFYPLNYGRLVVRDVTAKLVKTE